MSDIGHKIAVGLVSIVYVQEKGPRRSHAPCMRACFLSLCSEAAAKNGTACCKMEETSQQKTSVNEGLNVKTTRTQSEV